MDHSDSFECLHSVKLEGVVKMEEEVKKELVDLSAQGLHHIKEEEELDLGVEFGETEDGDSLQSEDFNEYSQNETWQHEEGLPVKAEEQEDRAQSGKRPFDELTRLSSSALPSATPDKLAVHPDLKRHSEEKSITVPCLELLSKSEGVEMCQSTVEEVSTSSELKKYRRGTDTASLTLKRYACDVCTARFSKSSNLKRHHRIHTKEKPYTCDVCQAGFTRSSYLEKHQSIHTEEKLYACDVCQATFTDSSNFKRHQIIHPKEKPHVCDVCSARFTQSANLKIHHRIHSKEKPYVCDVCQARFTQSNNLKQHKRIHTKEKPYACDVCTSKFTESSSLKKHQRIHSKEKPYACYVCQARFTQSNNLKRHKRIHAKEVPYAYDV